MDANKREKLVQIGYKIQPTCGNCKFLRYGDGGWGTCTKFTYEHGKHTETTRELSVNEDGHCSSHEFAEPMRSHLGGFAEFLPRGTK